MLISTETESNTGTCLRQEPGRHGRVEDNHSMLPSSHTCQIWSLYFLQEGGMSLVLLSSNPVKPTRIWQKLSHFY